MGNSTKDPETHNRTRRSTFSKIGRILGVVSDNDGDNSAVAVKDTKETTPVDKISPKFTAGSSTPPTGGSSRVGSKHTTPTASPSVTPVLRGTQPSRQSSLRLPKDASMNNSVSHLQLNALGNEPNGNGHESKQSPLLPRFKMLEGGNHEHHLRSSKRQEKLSSMLKGLLGAKKLRNESISAVPNILQSVVPELNQLAPTDKPPTLLSGLLNQVQKGEITAFSSHGQLNQPITAKSVHILEQADSKSFVEKYGTCQEVVGRGTFGVVRVSHKKLAGEKKERLHAVKEFKRKPQENDSKYSKRLTSEFCIASSLQHVNIIHTLDLLQDAKGDYCEVMEYCSGGDLYSLIITAGKLEYLEADCFFKQLIRGMEYMHKMGVAHRDLKPENLLITSEGNLKITDFGNAECFRMAWEDEIQLSSGVCGSSPYIAPEEFVEEEFDPRPVDVWACGLIYMAMRTGRQMWKIANTDDEFYATYLEKRKETKGYEPLELIKRARCRNVIYSILDPVASRRITGAQVLNSEWVREIKVCEAGEYGGEVLG